MEGESGPGATFNKNLSLSIPAFLPPLLFGQWSGGRKREEGKKGPSVPVSSPLSLPPSFDQFYPLKMKVESELKEKLRNQEREFIEAWCSRFSIFWNLPPSTITDRREEGTERRTKPPPPLPSITINQRQSHFYPPSACVCGARFFPPLILRKWGKEGREGEAIELARMGPLIREESVMEKSEEEMMAENSFSPPSQEEGGPSSLPDQGLSYDKYWGKMYKKEMSKLDGQHLTTEIV